MESDFQSIIIERIGKLDKTVKSLKASNKKLSEKFDDIEIQGFHDQVQALNKRIDELRDSVLNTQIQALSTRIDQIQGSTLYAHRVLADLLIEYTQFHFLSVSHTKLTDNPVLYGKIEEHIIIESTRAHETCANSPTPLNIAMNFRVECSNYSKQHKLGVYRLEI